MYLLIFEAWATLMGFTQGQNLMQWGDSAVGQLINEEECWFSSWEMLSQANPTHLIGDLLYGSTIEETYAMGQALMLTNIMTHVSMILIFVFFISFIIFLFRLFAHMLSRR